LRLEEIILAEISTRVEKFKNHVIPTNGALRKLVALKKNQVPYRRVLIMMEHSVEAGLLYGLSRPEEL
jgi:hypothetical protein